MSIHIVKYIQILKQISFDHVLACWLAMTIIIGACLWLNSVSSASWASSDPSIESVSLFTDQLAARLGTKIEVDSDLKQCRVLVISRGSEPKAVLEGLASALCATLRRTPVGWLIHRDHNDIQSFEDRREQTREQWIRNSINFVEGYRKQQLVTGYSSSTIVNEVQRNSKDVRPAGSRDEKVASYLLPNEELLLSLVRKIGPKTFAQLPSNTTEIFEDDPVEGALPLPNHESELSTYEDDLAKIRPRQLEPLFQAKLAATGSLEAYQDWLEVQVAPSRLRLGVSTADSSVSFTLEGYDQDGRLLFAQDFPCGPDFTRYSAWEVAGRYFTDPSAKWADLDTESITAARTAAKFEKNSPAWLLRPDSVEPLNFLVLAGLCKLAEEETSDCVVWLVTDDLWGASKRSVKTDRLNLDSLKFIIQRSLEMERVLGQGFVAWRPSMHLPNKDDVADRTEIRQLARASLAKSVDLRGLAAFHSSEGEQERVLGDFVHWAVLGSPGAPEPIGFRHAVYQMIGSISPDRWADLSRGSRFTAGELGITDRLSNAIRSGQVAVQGPGSFPDVYQHASELFDANSFPVSSVSFRVFDASQDLLGVRLKGAQGSPQWYRLKDFCGIEPVLATHREQPVLLTGRESFEALMSSKYELQSGSQSETLLEMGLPHQLYSRCEWKQPVRTDGTWISYVDLPELFRNRVWEAAVSEAMESARQIWKFSHPGRSGG